MFYTQIRALEKISKRWTSSVGDVPSIIHGLGYHKVTAFWIQSTEDFAFGASLEHW